MGQAACFLCFVCVCQSHSFHRPPFCTVTEPCDKAQTSNCHWGDQGWAASGGDVLWAVGSVHRVPQLPSVGCWPSSALGWPFIVRSNRSGHPHSDTFSQALRCWFLVGPFYHVDSLRSCSASRHPSCLWRLHGGKYGGRHPGGETPLHGGTEELRKAESTS